MPYKIIITAGGTTEKIDDVRSITNTSTGRRGSMIAEAFYKIDQASEITYICSHNAMIPNIPGLNVIKISNTAELKSTLEQLLLSGRGDAVIHAMAVSDYSLKGAVTAELLAKAAADAVSALKTVETARPELIREAILKAITGDNIYLDSSTKLASNYDNLMLSMKKNPKIIGLIKKLQPGTVLVGFKLLNKVRKEELIETGYQLLIKNNCDYVFANDLSSLHEGFLISPDKTCKKLCSYEEIAEGIAYEVINKLYCR